MVAREETALFASFARPLARPSRRRQKWWGFFSTVRHGVCAGAGVEDAGLD